MKRSKSYLLVCLLGLPYLALAQRDVYYSYTVINNAVAMPFSGQAGIIHHPVHLGLRLGAGTPIKEGERYRWMQHLHVGYMYQRLIHHVAQIYAENEIDFNLIKNFRGQSGLVLGYAHLTNTKYNKVFKKNDEGEYIRTARLGVPRLMGGINFGFGYEFSAGQYKVQPFLHYQFWVVAPFVKSYVPVLPNAALLVGANIHLSP